jgi:hypothetical protein
MAFNDDPTGLSFNKITLYILLTDLSWVSIIFSSSLFIRSVSFFIKFIFLTAMRLSISLNIVFISASRFFARGRRGWCGWSYVKYLFPDINFTVFW